MHSLVLALEQCTVLIIPHLLDNKRYYEESQSKIINLRSTEDSPVREVTPKLKI